MQLLWFLCKVRVKQHLNVTLNYNKSNYMKNTQHHDWAKCKLDGVGIK